MKNNDCTDDINRDYAKLSLIYDNIKRRRFDAKIFKDCLAAILIASLTILIINNFEMDKRGVLVLFLTCSYVIYKFIIALDKLEKIVLILQLENIKAERHTTEEE